MGRSLEETYAFSGVHHIFDHHKGFGRITTFHHSQRLLSIRVQCLVLSSLLTIEAY